MKPNNNIKVAYGEPVSYLEDVNFMEGPDHASYSSDHEQQMEPVSEFLEESVEDISKALKDLGSEFDEEDMISVEFDEGSYIPGTRRKSEEFKEEEKDKDWVNDNDVSKFMGWLGDAYPTGIPEHDGTSITGCERASNYLDRVNSQISKALKIDTDDVLDPGTIEGVRVQILKDVVVLKNHINKLKKMKKESSANSANELKKEATTPGIQVVATPFERALAGILINSVVSAGRPFEDVYDFLKKKYKLEEREELALMQLVMDMGFHIFKDRGSIGGEENLEVDFVTNYFG